MTAAAVNIDIEKGRRIRARKDAEGQEAILRLGELKERIGDLISLHNACTEATDAYGEAVKAVAEKAGIQAGVVRKFVAARAGEKFDDKRRDCEQLALCFEEIGQA